MKRIFGLVLLFMAFSALAQKEKSRGSAWLIKPSLGILTAGGDAELRFGTSLSAGLGGEFQTKKLWRFGLDAQFMFGNNVKNVEALLAPIANENGQIFSNLGSFGEVAILQRGYLIMAEAGRTLPFLKANNYSGIDFMVGAGFLSHWIHLQNFEGDLPQLDGEYDKGYDHLSGGFALRQSLGYQFLGKNRRANFRLSFEITEAFTQNYRGYDYTTNQPVSGSNLDLFYGARFAWILPIYSQSRAEDNNNYYYE